MSARARVVVLTTHSHVVKSLLGPHRVVHTSRGKGVEEYVLPVLFPSPPFLFRKGVEFFQELNGSGGQGNSVVDGFLRVRRRRPRQVLGQLGKQPVERRAVDQDLKNGIRKTHISTVHQSTRTKLRYLTQS